MKNKDNSYEKIRKEINPHINQDLAYDLGKSLIDGFKAYIKNEKSPVMIQNGAAAKGIAYSAAYTLALCVNQHGPHTSNDMKVTFLAFFDKMFDYYVKRLIEKEDKRESGEMDK